MLKLAIYSSKLEFESRQVNQSLVIVTKADYLIGDSRYSQFMLDFTINSQRPAIG